MKWWSLEFPVPSPFADAAAWLVAEALDHPVEIREETEQSAEFRRLVISFEEEPHKSTDDTIVRCLSELGIDRTVIERTSSEDRSWEDGWKRFFHTVSVSPRFAVRPPWDADAEDRPYTIVIEPGLAFGTGTHPTTAGCLNMLDRVLTSVAPTRMLDVGCGSAILGIAASLLGHEVVAIDIDADALQNARMNAEHNSVAASIFFHAVGPDKIQEQFNVVVANIIAPVLIQHAEAIKSCSRKHLILSGLLKHQESDILAAYSPWTVKDRITIGDWVILSLGRHT